MRRSPDRPFRLGRTDAIAAAVLAGIAILASWFLHGQLAFTRTNLDVWFESDTTYVLSQLTDHTSDHNDTNSRHPVYPVLAFGSVWMLDHVFGVNRESGSDVVLVISAALLALSAFLAMRLLGRPLVVAVLFTIVLLLASPGMLFLGVPERTILGGASVMAAVVAAAAAYRHGVVAQWPAVGATVVTVGITVTNFISAAPMLLAALGRRRAVRAVALGLGIVQAFALAGAMIFPNATTFPHIRVWRMSSVWSDVDEILFRGGNWTQKSTAFWTHAVAFPEPGIQHKLIAEPLPMRYVSYQKVGIERRGAAGQAAAALWLAGLGAGLALAIRRSDPLERAIAAALGAQALIFLLFGEETVLYAPYYVPLAVVLVSRAAAEWWPRTPVLVMTVAFVVALAANNVAAFAQARRLALSLVTSIT